MNLSERIEHREEHCKKDMPCNLSTGTHSAGCELEYDKQFHCQHYNVAKVTKSDGREEWWCTESECHKVFQPVDQMPVLLERKMRR